MKKNKSEFQLRKEQLEDLQQRANESGDLRAELDAIKEINKLCGLYAEPVDNGESAEAAIARRHLESLGIVEKGLPIEELARRVALIIGSNDQQNAQQCKTTKSKKKTRGAGAR